MKKRVCKVYTIILLFAVAFCLICKKRDAFADNSFQVKILDEYFEAINNLNLEAVNKICNNCREVDGVTKFDYFVKCLDFFPGELFFQSDFLSEENEVTTAYFRGLGYDGSYKDMIRSFNSDMEGDGEILLSHFKASYELRDIKNAEDCKFQYRSGISWIDVPDLKEEIEKGMHNIAIDEVYVAKLGLYWEYNGHPYGNDEKLWDLESFPETFSTYEETNAANNDMDYYEVIYFSNGEWYLWWDTIRKYSYRWKIEM